MASLNIKGSIFFHTVCISRPYWQPVGTLKHNIDVCHDDYQSRRMS